MNPLKIFTKWINEEKNLSKVAIPTAVCFSTSGIDGFPNARTVSFKEIVDYSFIVTGPLNSRKGKEINNNNKVALTFWWTETKRQVRVQGIASKIPNVLANYYFKDRDINSQAVSAICEQGKEIENLWNLEIQIKEKVLKKEIIKRPGNWGGFSIKPIRMEFMEFKESRFHDRTFYEFENNKWTVRKIQP
jgi:pyridoxamine 5'-phosphate oxidase